MRSTKRHRLNSWKTPNYENFIFFSEKGGVGKTLHTVMFADYLAYHLGKKVIVFDFDAPSHPVKEQRDRDQESLRDEGSELSRYMRAHLGEMVNAYDIWPIGKGGLSWTKQEVEDVVNKLKILKTASMCDYCLLDFKATLFDDDITRIILASGIVDLTAVILTATEQTIKRGTLTAYNLKDRANVVMFWNMLTKNEAESKMIDDREHLLVEKGFRFLQNRVRFFEKAKRDTDNKNFVVNTLCWPTRYVELNAPSLVPFYDELVSVIVP